MIKLSLLAVIVVSIGMSSCSEKSAIEKSADEFCECSSIEKMKDKNTCFEKWEIDFEGINISDNEIKVMTEKVESCSNGLTAGRYRYRVEKIRQ